MKYKYTSITINSGKGGNLMGKNDRKDKYKEDEDDKKYEDFNRILEKI